MASSGVNRSAGHGVDAAQQRYIRTSMNVALLSREEEIEFALRWRDHGDAAALHRLITAYTRMVIAASSRFRHYGLPAADLVQEGTIGLMQAASRFDPERNVRFSTYAAWWVRSAMQDYVLRNWSIVRTGTTAAQKTLFFGMRRLRAQLAVSGDLPTDEIRYRIAEELDIDVREVEKMEQRLGSGDQSLDAGYGEGADKTPADWLADDRPSPEDQVIEGRDGRVRNECLAKALAELSPREQVIIRQRRLSEEGVTLESLGRQLGISKERIRQLETRALEKLRQSLSRQSAFDDAR